MNIGLGYALFVSVVCAFFGWTNYGFVNLQTTKPVVCGALVGLILGDLRTGIIIGGTLTLVYMGVQGVGAAIPVNATTATTVTTALCIITGVEMETAIAIAVPVSVMGQLGRMAAWTINTPLMHIADKYAETADYKKMTIGKQANRKKTPISSLRSNEMILFSLTGCSILFSVIRSHLLFSVYPAGRRRRQRLPSKRPAARSPAASRRKRRTLRNRR